MDAENQPDEGWGVGILVRTLLVFCLAILVMGLVACGGGGSSDYVYSQESGNGRDGELEFVTAVHNPVLSDLVAIPSSSPDAGENITGLQGVSPAMLPAILTSGSLSQGTVGSIASESVVYGREDGTLWRVGTGEDAFPPVPSEVSSADNVQHACWDSIREYRYKSLDNYQASSLPSEAMTYADLEDFDNTPIVMAIKTQPGDQCTDTIDTEWQYVRLGDSHSQPPRPFPTPDYSFLSDVPIVSLRNDAGGYEGWLLKKDGHLIRWQEGGNVSKIRENISDFSALGRRQDGSLYIQIDGSLNLYHPETNQLDSLGFQFKENRVTHQNRPANSISDGNSLFFVEHHVGSDANDAADDKIALYRASPNGVTTYSAETTAAVQNSYDLVLTHDYIVWHYSLASSDTVMAFGKENASLGGPVVTDVQTYGENSGAGLFDVTDPTGDWIFYNHNNGAYALRLSDAHSVHFPSRHWITGTLARDRQPGYYRVVKSMVVGQSMPGSSLLALTSIATENLEQADIYADLGVVDIGMLPGPSLETLFPYGYGEGRSGLFSDPGESAYTTLYWRAEQAGSLQAIDVGAVYGMPVTAF